VWQLRGRREPFEWERSIIDNLLTILADFVDTKEELCAEDSWYWRNDQPFYVKDTYKMLVEGPNHEQSRTLTTL